MAFSVYNVPSFMFKVKSSQRKWTNNVDASLDIRNNAANVKYPKY